MYTMKNLGCEFPAVIGRHYTYYGPYFLQNQPMGTSRDPVSFFQSLGLLVHAEESQSSSLSYFQFLYISDTPRFEGC